MSGYNIDSNQQNFIHPNSSPSGLGNQEAQGQINKDSTEEKTVRFLEAVQIAGEEQVAKLKEPPSFNATVVTTPTTGTQGTLNANEKQNGQPEEVSTSKTQASAATGSGAGERKWYEKIPIISNLVATILGFLRKNDSANKQQPEATSSAFDQKTEATSNVSETNAELEQAPVDSIQEGVKEKELPSEQTGEISQRVDSAEQEKTPPISVDDVVQLILQPGVDSEMTGEQTTNEAELGETLLNGLAFFKLKPDNIISKMVEKYKDLELKEKEAALKHLKSLNKKGVLPEILFKKFCNKAHIEFLENDRLQPTQPLSYVNTPIDFMKRVANATKSERKQLIVQFSQDMIAAQKDAWGKLDLTNATLDDFEKSDALSLAKGIAEMSELMACTGGKINEKAEAKDILRCVKFLIRAADKSKDLGDYNTAQQICAALGTTQSAPLIDHVITLKIKDKEKLKNLKDFFDPSSSQNKITNHASEKKSDVVIPSIANVIKQLTTLNEKIKSEGLEADLINPTFAETHNQIIGPILTIQKNFYRGSDARPLLVNPRESPQLDKDEQYTLSQYMRAAHSGIKGRFNPEQEVIKKYEEIKGKTYEADKLKPQDVKALADIALKLHFSLKSSVQPLGNLGDDTIGTLHNNPEMKSEEKGKNLAATLSKNSEIIEKKTLETIISFVNEMSSNEKEVLIGALVDQLVPNQIQILEDLTQTALNQELKDKPEFDRIFEKTSTSQLLMTKTLQKYAQPLLHDVISKTVEQTELALIRRELKNMKLVDPEVALQTATFAVLHGLANDQQKIPLELKNFMNMYQKSVKNHYPNQADKALNHQLFVEFLTPYLNVPEEILSNVPIDNDLRAILSAAATHIKKMALGEEVSDEDVVTLTDTFKEQEVKLKEIIVKEDVLYKKFQKQFVDRWLRTQDHYEEEVSELKEKARGLLDKRNETQKAINKIAEEAKKEIAGMTGDDRQLFLDAVRETLKPKFETLEEIKSDVKQIRARWEEIRRELKSEDNAA